MAKYKTGIEITGKSTKAQAAIKKTNQDLDKMKSKVGGMKSTLSSFKAGWLAVAAGLAVGLKFTKKMIDAAAFQQKQQVTLAAAMKQAGTFTEAAFQENLKYASSLQRMTTFGDEAILGVQKMLTNFGIEGKQMKDLTKVTLDLAAAKGMDLKAAADLVAKSVGSSTNALSRYGIEITGAVGSTERAEMAVANITKLFGGAAAAEADTYAGAVEQMTNAIGDAAEGIGFMLIPALTKAVKWITKTVVAIQDIPDTFGEAKTTTVAFAVGVKKALQLLGNAVKLNFTLMALAVVRTFNFMFQAIRIPVNLAIMALNKLRDTQMTLLDDVGEATAQNLQKRVLEIAEETAAIITGNEERKESTLATNAEITEKTLEEIEAIKQAALDKEFAEMNEKIRKLKIIEALEKERIESISKADAEAIKKRKKMSDAWVKSTIKTTQLVGSLVQQTIGVFKSAFDARIRSIDAEKNKQIEALKAQGLSAEEFIKKKTELEERADEEKRKMQSAAWVTEKISAIISIIVRGAVAVMRAWSEFPAPIAAAITAIIAGIQTAQIAIVASQKNPYKAARGADFTVPEGFGNDNFPMAVSSGERVKVTPREDSERIRALEDQGVEAQGEMAGIIIQGDLIIQTNDPDTMGEAIRERALQMGSRAVNRTLAAV